MEFRSRHRTYLAIISVVFFSVLATQVFGFAYANSLQVHRRIPAHEKGLLIDARVILWNENSPSFAELRSGGFTLVGTYVKADFGPGDWDKIAAWIGSAHEGGFTTFIMIGVPLVANVSMAIDWCRRAASMGADVVELDEIISKLNANKTDIMSIITAGLLVNPRLQFIITEWGRWYFQQAYSWTSQYPSVRVANDEYDNKTRIDMNIQLGSQYGKRALTWLILIQGSHAYDCFLHLDDWISYVRQRDTDVLFYLIDHGNAWPLRWAKIMSF